MRIVWAKSYGEDRHQDIRDSCKPEEKSLHQVWPHSPSSFAGSQAKGGTAYWFSRMSKVGWTLGTGPRGQDDCPVPTSDMIV